MYRHDGTKNDAVLHVSQSETLLTKNVTRVGTAMNEALENQIKSLEEIFEKIKDSLLVRSYRELLSRWR